jgi:hypothetical protein
MPVVKEICRQSRDFAPWLNCLLRICFRTGLAPWAFSRVHHEFRRAPAGNRGENACGPFGVRRTLTVN